MQIVVLLIQSWGKDGSSCGECVHQIMITMYVSVMHCQCRTLHIYVANALADNTCLHARKSRDEVQMRKYDAGPADAEERQCLRLLRLFCMFPRSDNPLAYIGSQKVM
jgi:hypothetical protein